jgi:hypothetical protein
MFHIRFMRAARRGGEESSPVGSMSGAAIATALAGAAGSSHCGVRFASETKKCRGEKA